MPWHAGQILGVLLRDARLAAENPSRNADILDCRFGHTAYELGYKASLPELESRLS
jgi:hypothetical protein